MTVSELIGQLLEFSSDAKVQLMAGKYVEAKKDTSMILDPAARAVELKEGEVVIISLDAGAAIAKANAHLHN